ncbi:MAG TPA: disulfide bond formation protein B [Xanthobacteraceae bacterium]|jgi:disulfide bond formation protein DsbB|nr:disulfide bond formation protein B [Xanthobacteraceae bacterium]
MTFNAIRGRATTTPLTTISCTIAAIAAATLAGAWFFELVLGYRPCPLCLDQRVPYYIAVPAGLMLGIMARDPKYARLARWGLIALGLVLVYGSGFGVYHAGIEWGFWKGPASCTGTLRPPGDILSSLQNSQFVPCDRAAWTFLGISLAGYNALIAGALAVLAFLGARRPA